MAFQKDYTDVSTVLFEDSKLIEERRRDRMRQEANKFKFVPSINKKSDTVVRLLGKDFYERMEGYSKKRELKLSKTSW